ncbi:MAG: protoporphyrinogen oxidase [Elusimicrobia bacterium]|nr:protoporphyrinogen oxidase [Elusimicrobiota bacterium]
MTQAVLLIGFGGPTKADEVRPFMDNVLRGRPVPRERYEEVVKQYERIGGASPYNAQTSQFALQLRERLRKDGAELPIYVGMRNWNPTLRETLEQMARDGVQEAVGVVMSTFRSEPSWDRYVQAVDEARQAVGSFAPVVRYLPPWNEDMRFIQAVAQRVRETQAVLISQRQKDAQWIFTAHSIPSPLDAASGYSKQIARSAQMVAKILEKKEWTQAYQSRSGHRQDPWLEPDVNDLLRSLAGKGAKDVVVIPLGFISDHVEVLYDLDVKARETAVNLGLNFLRAGTVGPHPFFLSVLSVGVRRLLKIQAGVRPPGPAASEVVETAVFESGTPDPSGGLEVSEPEMRKGRGAEPSAADRPTPRIIVIGAGITGLAAAHRLMELSKESGHPVNVRVFEASSRAGGVISTRREDGFLWEEGPDSFITEKPWAAALCKRLGLELEMVGTNPAFQKSFVLRDGRLHPTPEGFYLLAPSRIVPFLGSSLFSIKGKMRMALEGIIPPAKDVADESLASFVRRRFGREALERIAQPMVAGVYTADPELLSLRATFPRFLEMEAAYGSVLRALLAGRRKRSSEKKETGLPASGVSGPRYSLFMTLKGGLFTLVDALHQKLPAGALRLHSPVRFLQYNSGCWTVHLASGEAVTAQAVCVALPAPEAAALLREVDGTLVDLLKSVPYTSSATLHLAYPRARVNHPLNGFGFVVPAIENKSLIGCSFSSVKFSGRAPEEHVLLRVFLGGESYSKRFANLADPKVIETVLRDLEEILGIQGAPSFASLKRHAFSMPQYTVGHLDRITSIEWRSKTVPRLALAGNAYRGIGLPDCIRSGEEAVERLWNSVFSETPEGR